MNENSNTNNEETIEMNPMNDEEVQVFQIEDLNFDVNIFRNNIDFLINTIPVATKTNGQNVFSYINLNRVFTQGIETEWSYKPIKNLLLAAGYQYLEAKDQDKLDKIKQGALYGNNDSGKPIKIKTSDYFGISGRSKHSFNAKIFYENFPAQLFGNIRAIYRGKYGFSDQDGNGIINNEKELAPGYFLLNASIGKNITRALKLQVGCDNLTDYKDPRFNPEFSGRQYWVNLQLKIK